MDRIVTMIFRQVAGRLMNRGIDAGVSRMTRGAAHDATPAQQARAQAQARQTAGRVKQALQLARRIGRF